MNIFDLQRVVYFTDLQLITITENPDVSSFQKSPAYYMLSDNLPTLSDIRPALSDIRPTLHVCKVMNHIKVSHKIKQKPPKEQNSEQRKQFSIDNLSIVNFQLTIDNWQSFYYFCKKIIHYHCVIYVKKIITKQTVVFKSWKLYPAEIKEFTLRRLFHQPQLGELQNVSGTHYPTTCNRQRNIVHVSGWSEFTRR